MRFDLPAVKVEATELGVVTVRGLKFSERVELFADSPEGPMFAAKLLALAASVVGEPMSADDWDVYGGIHQDDYIALVQAASEQSGFNREAVEKK